jgi:hypothetical protein
VCGCHWLVTADNRELPNDVGSIKIVDRWLHTHQYEPQSTRAIKFWQIRGKCTDDDTHERFTYRPTWLYQTFCQCWILNSNIMLVTVQCLRYINIRDVSAGAVHPNLCV